MPNVSKKYADVAILYVRRIRVRQEMKNFRPLVFFFALFSVMGCVPECDNVPPKEYIAKNVDVLGDYWAQATKSTRQDVTIKRSEDADFPYVININVFGGRDRQDFLFQLYKIGDLTLAFAKPQTPPNAEMAKQCFAMNLTVTKTQIAMDTMGNSFFIKNSFALRGVEQIDKNRVKLHADPEQLAAFFKLHGKTKELFWPNESLLLNRR